MGHPDVIFHVFKTEIDLIILYHILGNEVILVVEDSVDFLGVIEIRV